MARSPTNRFNFYLEVAISHHLINARIASGQSVDEEWCRRLISIYVSEFHAVARSSSIMGLPIDICTTIIQDKALNTKIRIFCKSAGTLAGIFHPLSKHPNIIKTAHLSEIKPVPENITELSILMRLRLPSKKTDPVRYEIAKNKMDIDPLVDYILLMPSSNKRADKTLMRYYFKRLVPQADMAKRADSYGFSIKSRIAMVPQF